ncbi:MAG: M48 family metallopeptidase [Acidobacteriota bacterium]
MNPSPKAALAVLLALAGALLVATLAACVTNPATGRSQLVFYSMDEEIRLGHREDPRIRAEFGVYDDPRLAAWFEALSGKVARASDQPGYDYRFAVLDSPVVNAFALPGGPVYATRGLLAYAGDEAEVAGVMGHEIGHVNARHGVEQMSRQQLLGGVVNIASLLSPKARRAADLLGTAAGLLLLQYSRNHEREADALGVRYSFRAGYDPEGVARFLGVLDGIAARSGQALPVWLSTHPDPGRRAERARELAAPLVARARTEGRTLIVGRETLRARLDGLVWGDDPRQGFVLDGAFRHPELRFRFDVPPGWKLSNTPRRVVVYDDARQTTALLELTPAGGEDGRALSPEDQARRLAAEQAVVALDGRPETIHGLAAWIGLATVSDGAGGTFPVLVAFVAHRENVYRLTGRWAAGVPGRRAELERAVRSFREETDPAVLAVRPVVLRFEDVPAGTRIADLCARREVVVDCAELRLVNRLGTGPVVARSRWVKLPVRQSAVFPP